MFHAVRRASPAKAALEYPSRYPRRPPLPSVGGGLEPLLKKRSAFVTEFANKKGKIPKVRHDAYIANERAIKTIEEQMNPTKDMPDIKPEDLPF
jgi:hypothetical protein